MINFVNLPPTDIEQLKHKISFAIEQMTLQGMNLKNVNLEKNDLSSQNGLLKEYKKLSIQLKQLQILEKKHSTQLEQLTAEERTIVDEIQKYSQLDVSCGCLVCEIKINA